LGGDGNEICAYGRLPHRLLERPKDEAAQPQDLRKAISICIDEKVDFALIAGDLFNTALPSIESLKIAVENLKRLKDSG
jgi:DNA repair exonuclease SbcCD nuclease subunit